MKNLGRSITRALLVKKVFFNPIGLTILLAAFIFVLAMVFTAFPKNGGFDINNPDRNKDFLDKRDDSNNVYAKCSIDGEIDIAAMSSVFAGAGVFDKMHDTFIEVASDNNIDPILFSAIAMHETGYGTSKMVKERNNPGGLFDSKNNDFYRFESLEEGLDAMAANLYKNYYAMGLFTISDIGKKYAPLDVENDPNNLNIHWIPTVTKISNNMGGLVMHCELLNTGDFVFPVDNPAINSHYGNRVHPISGEIKLHSGTDFACSLGNQVYAVQDGVVVDTRSENGGLGNFVIIEHQESIYTAYGHLDEITISKGSKVASGETVGLCGSSGYSTGPHLHLEVRLGNKYGETVDPMNYLPPL